MSDDRPELRLNRQEDVLELRLPPVFGGRIRRQLEKEYLFEPRRHAYIAAVTAKTYGMAKNLGSQVTTEDEDEIKMRLGGGCPAPGFEEKREVEHPSDHPMVGRFVKITDREDLGTGKVRSVVGGTVAVEFFDMPAAESEWEVHHAPLEKICQIELHRQQRVYLRDYPQQGLWGVGRHRGPHGPVNLLIDLPNKVQKPFAPGTVYVRWAKPIRDPSLLLAAQVSETPYFNVRRSEFVHAFLGQRAATGGLSAYLSSSIRLESYQYAVVKQILQDPTQRYLLADEVGLGKTIEAGIILRQYVLDHPKDHRVLVVVPDALVSQWKDELRTRFSLGRFLGQTIEVHSYGEMQSADLDDMDQTLGLLVVDEAHHLTVGRRIEDIEADPLYSRIRRLALASERLLLLSATPVHSNELGFLALLHLLDPAVYRLEDVGRFRERVAKRTDIADQFHNIGPDVPAGLLGIRATQVRELLPDDTKVQEIAAAIEDDPYAPQVPALARDLKTHIGETYRLHRRLLRNRRSAGPPDRLPGRRGLGRIEYQSEPEDRLFDGLENWRYSVADQPLREQFSDVYRCLCEAWMCGSESLKAAISLRLGLREANMKDGNRFSLNARLTAVPVGAEEDEVLARILSDCDRGSLCTAKMKALSQAVLKLVEEYTRVVLFASSDLCHVRLLGVLRSLFGDEVAALGGLTVRDQSAVLDRFRHGDVCVLLCDAQAEEGLNLHGEQVAVVHYDIPLNPNRIEQRMGRADRYGAGREVQSVLAWDASNWLLDGWVRILDEAYCAFDRSIASLQYRTDTWMRELWSETFAEGPPALKRWLNALAGEEGGVEVELKRIGLQDDLDALHAVNGASDLAALVRVEANTLPFQEGIHAWCCTALQVGLVSPETGVLRYQYQEPGGGSGPRGNTLLPEEEFWRRFASSIEGRPRQDRQAETVAMTFSRETAVARGIPLLRYGNEFLADTYKLTLEDDRGRSFACWRYLPDDRPTTDPDAFFRLDFLVEGNVDAALARYREAGADVDPATLGRSLDQFFPPLIETIWFDAGPAVVVEPPDWVTADYERGGRDRNITATDWERMGTWYPTDYWQSLVMAVRVRAEKELRGRTGLAERVQAATERAADMFRERLARIQARITAAQYYATGTTSSDCIGEQQLQDSVLAGLRHPHIVLDSIGAVIVANFSPFPKGATFDGSA